MDSIASLALATELPKPELLKRLPQNREDYIVSRKMTKHILGQAIWQCIVLFIFLFAGEHLIPESDITLQFDRPTGYVYPGRATDWDGKDLYTKEIMAKHGASRHLTFIFNSFVFMQIFNMICARKIHDEWNIFAGILENTTFCILWFVIIGGQALICQFGSRVFVVNLYGLDGPQWGISFGVGITSFAVNAILKLIPDGCCPKIGKDSVDERRVAALLARKENKL
jgi:Ca2+ transporting ATPase